MTLRTHKIEKKNPQHNQEWSWEETPEFVDALLKLETSTELLGNIKLPTLHVPNANAARGKKKRVQ